MIIYDSETSEIMFHMSLTYFLSHSINETIHTTGSPIAKSQPVQNDFKRILITGIIVFNLNL